MADKHIKDILDDKPFASLTDADHSTIRAHTATCEECARAYKVAVVASAMLSEHGAETVEPSPFFHTRVLAALRERQTEAPAFKRLWRTAGALVSSMAAAVVLFGALAFLAPATPTVSSEASAFNRFSAESVILDETAQAQGSDAEVLSTIYEAEDER